jgi:hypothetical protein
VENALDAAESIEALPSIKLQIEEIRAEEFDAIRGLSVHNKVGDWECCAAEGRSAGAVEN